MAERKAGDAVTPAGLLADVVRPTLRWMGERYCGRRAELMMLSIHLQEDPNCLRRQVNGPARGAWMFEPGGVQGVLAHDRSARDAYRIAVSCGFGHDPDFHEIASAMQDDDHLACAFARLLLWTDPDPLPAVGDQAAAWGLYLRLWRPGRPRPLDWSNSYGAALAAVTRPEGLVA